MKLHFKLGFYSVTNETNWMFLWVSIARLAYGMGDIDCANHAQKKARAAYSRARRLLQELNRDDQGLRSLARDLEALRVALEQLPAEPNVKQDCACSR
jgi:hypothetical protein